MKSFTLVDPDGKEVTELTVPGEGKYTIDPETGKITFQPEPDFVGKATPVDVRGYDANGNSADTTYMPTVIPSVVLPTEIICENDTSKDVQGATQKGKPNFESKSDDVTIESYKLLDENGKETDTLTVDGEGAYTIDPATGEVTFVPEADFVGTATPVSVQATASNGQKKTATYTPTVTPVAPATITGKNDVSKGYVGESQSGKPVFESSDKDVAITGYTLKDPATGKPVNNVTVPGEGTYTIDPATGTVTFVPEKGFTGKAGGVTVEATNAKGTKATATYTPTVIPQPSGKGTTSQDIQGATQKGTPAFKDGEGKELKPSAQNPAKIVVDGKPVDATSVPAMCGDEEVGKYTLDPATGEVTFVPEADFVGTPDPITIRVTNEDGKSASATYTPTVTPVVPTAASATSQGAQGEAQTGTPKFTEGSEKVPMKSYTLLDKNGNEVKQLTVDGEGKYTIDPATGEIRFEPEPAFTGGATPVSVKGYDANGTPATTTYTPFVLAALPAAKDAVSTGAQGEPQTGKPVFEPGSKDAVMASYMLVDENGNPTKTVVVPGEGTYTIDPETGVITFVPEKSFTGTAGGVTVQAVDSFGAKVNARYTPTVNPVIPLGNDADSSDAMDQTQKGRPTFTNGDGSELKPSAENPARFVVDGKPVDDKTIPAMNNGEQVGTFTIDPATGEITFVPNEGYVGDVDSVVIEVCDKNGTPARATYTVKVLGNNEDPVPENKPEAPKPEKPGQEDPKPEDKQEPKADEPEKAQPSTSKKYDAPVNRVVTAGSTRATGAPRTTTVTPQTGDKNHMALNLSLIFGALGTMAAAIFRRKKKNEEEED